MNAEISETMGAMLLRFGVQIPELLTRRKFVSVDCHAHSNAHKPPKTVTPKVLILDRNSPLLSSKIVEKINNKDDIRHTAVFVDAVSVISMLLKFVQL